MPEVTALAIVARPFDKLLETEYSYPEGPLGLFPFGDAGRTFTVTGGLRYVTAATKAFTSDAGDSPGHQPFPGLLQNAFNYSINLFEGIDPINTTGRSGIGAITLQDESDLLGFEATQLSWDSREISIYRGVHGSALSSYTKVAQLITAGFTEISATQKTVALRDKQSIFYKTQVLGSYLAGTGGVEGDSAQAGQLIPHAYGWVFWIEPIIVNAGLLIMRWHDREVQGVDGFFDGGSPLSFTSNYATYALLAAASLSPGQYATCNALGLVRAGGVPSRGFRLNGRGDKLGGVFVEKRGDIIRRIVTTRGQQPLNDPDELDTASFTQFNTDQAAPIGIYIDDPNETMGSMIDKLMSGVSGWWYMTLLGKLVVGLLSEPKSVADFTFDAARKEILDEIKMEGWLQPRLTTIVNYREYVSPQQPSELVGGLTATQIVDYGQQWRASPFTQEGVRLAFPTARVVTVDGYFKDKADADAEALRQSNLLAPERRTWSCTVRLDAFQNDIVGKTIRILNYNKHGFGMFKNFYIKGMNSIQGGVYCQLYLWAGV